MLEFILGRAGSGKTKYVRRMLTDKLNNNEKNLLLLVPEQFSFESEKMLLSSVGAEKMMNIQVLSFSRLANGVIENTPYFSMPRIDDGGRAVLLRLALDALGDKVKIYKKFKSNFNGLSSLLSFIQEMKQCEVSPSDLSDKTDSVTGILSEKLKELSLIFEAYDAFTSDGYFDDYNLLTVANAYFTENGFFKGKTVVLDAFTGYTAQEMKIVDTILKQAKDVYITLCADSFDGYDEYSPFAFINATAKRIVSLAEKNNVEMKKTVLVNKDKNRYTEDLEYLEKNLYSDSFEKYSGNEENISIIRCPSRFDECREVSREIKRLMREENVRCRDIAVFERTSGTYDKTLSYMFKKYDIPYFEDERMPVSNNPLVMAVRYALRIASRGMDTDRIISLLKTGMTSLSDAEISLLETYCYVWSIKGSEWKKEWINSPDGFNSKIDEQAEKELEEINNLRKQVYLWINSFLLSFKDVDGKQKSEAVYGFLKNIGADKSLCSLAHFLSDRGQSAVALEQERVWNTLMDILDSLAVVIPNESVSASRYTELFEIFISSRTLGTVPQGLDNVAVADAQRSRLSSPDYLFVLGLNDGEFPKDRPNNGIFTESERRILTENGLEILPACDGRFAEERYIAYHAITSASKRLYLLYNSGSSESGTDAPSEVIEKIKEIFPFVTEKQSSQNNSLNDIESEKCAFSLLASTWNEKSDFSSEIKGYFSSREDYSGVLDAMKRVSGADKRETRIVSKDTARKLFKNDMYLSASRVEEYYKCPFKYFCRYALYVNALKKADIDASFSGTIIHHCLEVMIKKHKRSIADLSSSQRRNEVRRILDDFAKENMDSNNGRTQKFLYNYNFHVDIVCRLLDRLIDEFRFSDFTPVEFELPIRADADVQPYEVAASDGSRVRINGYIDRVDLMQKDSKSYVRIVDYKSGSKKFDKSDIDFGLNCQMFIYLFALWKNGGKLFPNFVPSGVLYFKAKDMFSDVDTSMSEEDKQNAASENKTMSGVVLNDDEVILGMDKNDSGVFIPATTSDKSNAISLEEFERFRTVIEEAISQMAVRLHEGEIPIYPTKHGKSYDKICDYCDYKFVCGIDDNDARRTNAKEEVTELEY